MRILITGITGFVGSHLAEYALRQGAEVFGSIRWRSKTENIEHLRTRITLIESELRDISSVHELLEVADPDYVFHLAAQSFVHASWQTPAETLYTNTVSQVNLLEAIRKRPKKPRFLVVGSSEEYGLVYEDELPVKETNPLRPLSPYAVSKVAQDLMGYQYFMSYRLPIVRTRGFNHEGPRRGDVFATSNFARQIAEIEAGRREAVIHVGNLAARRDYTDVRDIIRGYWLLLQQGEPGEGSRCRGRGPGLRGPAAGDRLRAPGTDDRLRRRPQARQGAWRRVRLERRALGKEPSREPARADDRAEPPPRGLGDHRRGADSGRRPQTARYEASGRGNPPGRRPHVPGRRRGLREYGVPRHDRGRLRAPLGGVVGPARRGRLQGRLLAGACQSGRPGTLAGAGRQDRRRPGRGCPRGGGPALPAPGRRRRPPRARHPDRRGRQ